MHMERDSSSHNCLLFLDFVAISRLGPLRFSTNLWKGGVEDVVYVIRDVVGGHTETKLLSTRMRDVHLVIADWASLTLVLFGLLYSDLQLIKNYRNVPLMTLDVNSRSSPSKVS